MKISKIKNLNTEYRQREFILTYADIVICLVIYETGLVIKISEIITLQKT